jgi:tetratricopeptide (TPR) repeat protein
VEQSGTGSVSPVEELEAATKRMIDTTVDLGKKERLIRDKDRDIETIKNYFRQLKTEYEQEIYKKDAEIQTLKVSFKGSLSPLQPSYLGRSEPGKIEYEQRIQKKEAEIQALKAALGESLPPVQSLSAPGTRPTNPSKPTKIAMLLEIANRTNKNLLKARAGVHIVNANNSLREGTYRDAHESAFRAEKIIDDNKLERDFSYARIIFCKAQAEYGLGRLQVATELFNKARSHGIDGEDIDPWIEKCMTGSEPRPSSGSLDYLKDWVGSGLLRNSSVRSFGSGNNTPVQNSGPGTPRTPTRGSWLPRADSF